MEQKLKYNILSFLIKFKDMILLINKIYIYIFSNKIKFSVIRYLNLIEKPKVL